MKVSRPLLRALRIRFRLEVRPPISASKPRKVHPSTYGGISGGPSFVPRCVGAISLSTVRLQSEALAAGIPGEKREPCLHRARLLPWLVAELDRNPAQRERVAGDIQRVGSRPGRIRI
jgi:hypothetical protein